MLFKAGFVFDTKRNFNTFAHYFYRVSSVECLVSYELCNNNNISLIDNVLCVC